MKIRFGIPPVRRKAFRKPKPSVAKTEHRLQDGPLDGHKLYMCTSGTLAFKLQGQRGYYGNDNQWRQL